MRRWVIVGLLGLTWAGPASGQELVLRVPLARAVFAWDHPDPASVDEWVFECGSAPVRIPKAEVPTSLRVPLDRVITAPGTYTCQLRAVNAFGTSEPSNAVRFEAGVPPAGPVEFRVVIP